MDGKFDVRSIQTATHVVLINDVVMNKGPGVVNFDCGCGINGGVRKTAEGARRTTSGARDGGVFPAMQGIGRAQRRRGTPATLRTGRCLPQWFV